MSIKNGDMPASPSDFNFTNQLGKNIHEMNTGLTKREAFAMAAMQGILASKYISDFARDGRDISGHNQTCDDVEAISRISISYADQLLKELSK